MFVQRWYAIRQGHMRRRGFPLRTDCNGLEVDPWVDQELLTKMAKEGFVVPELDPNAQMLHRLKAGKEMIIERVVGVCLCSLTMW